MKYLVGLLFLGCVLCNNSEKMFERYKGADDVLDRMEFEQIFLQFDENGDRNITKQEFTDGWKHFDLDHPDHAPFDFLELDRNGDNQITANPDLDLMFDFFDDNNNNEVDKDEYKDNWKALFEH